MEDRNEKRRWTQEELNILMQYYPIEGEFVAKRLSGRTPKSCKVKAGKLGILKEKAPDVIYNDNERKNPDVWEIHKWTPEEDAVLKKYYPSEGTKVSHRISGRTAQACRSRASYLGISFSEGHKPWTKKEDRILRNYYETEGSKVNKRLPGRSSRACISRAKILQLSQRETWTEDEIRILREFYPSEGQDVEKRLPGKNVQSCYKKANTLGIKKKDARIPWSETEDMLLKKYYPGLGSDGASQKLKEELGITRSAYACRGRAHVLQITYEQQNGPWTKDEEDIIKRYFAQEGYDVSKRLKGRKRSACIAKIKKMGLASTGLYQGPQLEKWMKEKFGQIEKIENSMMRSEIIFYPDNAIPEIHVVGIMDKEGCFKFSDEGHTTKVCSLSQNIITTHVNQFGLEYSNGEIILRCNEFEGSKMIFRFVSCCCSLLYYDKTSQNA